jgi:GTP-binding protein
MQFIDEAKVRVEAGTGGHGIISWRREKYVPKGGPDGGNGGHGGSVYFEADPQLSTLLDFRYKRTHKAPDGNPGAGSNCTGRSGEDAIVRVPVGTVVRDASTGKVLADLVKPHERLLIARGGRGGLGNAEFATPTNQAPRKQTNGAPGEAYDVELELKLLADVALVGFPNAGKSTLISRISAANPKIADYPFTTLVPNLGIVQAPEEHKSFVVADIPGLIEGASEGKGLGHQFLRHIERTHVLLFLLDGTEIEHEIKQAYKTLKAELKSYSKAMLMKPVIIAITKVDAITDEQRKAYEKMSIDRKRPMLISAVTGEAIPELVARLWHTILDRKQQELVAGSQPDKAE